MSYTTTPADASSGATEVRTWPDGTRSWWRYGQRHRMDGPAVEYPDGYREWYRDGRLHREDGPAIEGASGYREWWRDGQRYREEGGEPGGEA
jgi:hypothetical protein